MRCEIDALFRPSNGASVLPPLRNFFCSHPHALALSNRSQRTWTFGNRRQGKRSHQEHNIQALTLASAGVAGIANERWRQNDAFIKTSAITPDAPVSSGGAPALDRAASANFECSKKIKKPDLAIRLSVFPHASRAAKVFGSAPSGRLDEGESEGAKKSGN